MLENWTTASFYIMSELWGSVIYTLLFWQVANFITPTEQAKRFYPLIIGTIAQVGPYSAGYMSEVISVYSSSLGSPELAWSNTLTMQMIIVSLGGLGLVFTYWYINKFVMTDKTQYDPELMGQATPKKKKVKLSLSEGIKLIFSSKYLGLIGILVVSYGISINLVEAMWKASLRMYAPTENEYNLFMGKFMRYSTIGVVIGMVIGVQTMRLFSWFVNAVATPLMIGITGTIFFVLFMYRHDLEPRLAVIGFSALTMAVMVGAVQNILSKATKYTVFDPTKEMSYIPLNDELKTKGKAAVDVVGSRFGKSGGALIQYLLMSFTAMPLIELGNILFGIFIVIIAIWIFGVKMLSKEYEIIRKK
jgi:AAA family ATP:ADP antiporter